MHKGNRLAAVDLGSNSFRLEIGRVDHGVFQRTEYLKETVRQGAGLDEQGDLTPQAMQNGWDCLARFGERLAGFGVDEVRAVATQTLREARNRDVFLERANAVLGFPINVISGREEARLIYQGVAHMLPHSDEKRLVIDIGGRSTELILGKGLTPLVMESFPVGSIGWSKRFFAEGLFTRKAFTQAEVAAKAVLDEALEVYKPQRWDMVYGSAGTVGAIGDVLVAAGWPAGVVTQQGLDWLMDQLLAAQSTDRLKIAGMREDRKAIIGGGVSTMRALFSLLGIESMQQATGGLRHGLICDLLGTTHTERDLQESTIRRLVTKFGADTQHGERISQVALTLHGQLIDNPSEQVHHRKQLHWASLLHEIGSHISHSDVHKHGAYILDHADAMGFSISEMHRLSQLVLGHRGKLRKMESTWGDVDVTRQLLAMRLAIILCHARRAPDLQGIRLTQPQRQTSRFELQCPRGWSENFPQSAHLLREESAAWQKTPWRLDVIGC